MRKKVLAFLLVLALLCTYAPASLAGGYEPDSQATVTVDAARAQAIDALQQISDGDLILEQDGAQTFLSGKLSGKKTVGSASAIQFLNTYKSLFGIDDAAKELRKQKTIKGTAGDTVIRFDQLIDGIPVEGNALNVHFGRDGSIISVNGNFLKDKTITALGSGSIAEADAVEAAKKQFTYDSLRDTPSVQRVILTKDGKNYDTYKVNISYKEPDIGNYDVYVEAHTGEVVATESNIRYDGDATGTGVDVTGITRDLNLYYFTDLSLYAMADYIRLEKGVLTADAKLKDLVTSSTNTFNSENYKASVSAHYFAGAVVDFYKQLFNRNSLDDNGMAVVSFTHYGTHYNNAFWDGYEMVYGDGDGVMFTWLSGDLDVVGHEMTHAVVEHTADLSYHNQSGALNESFADTFGVLIETYNKYNVESAGLGAWAFDPADWIIGDAIYTPAISGDALRSLEDPTLYDQPDNMSDYWNLPDTEDGDWGGVHENSGIPNKAAFLIAQAIGMQKTANIYYTALNQYIGPYTDFAGARDCLVQAATDLYGADSTEVSAVGSAFLAVGVVQASSDMPKLSSITFDYGTMSPAFDPNTHNYDLFVDNALASIQLTVGKQDPRSTVKISGVVAASLSIPVTSGVSTVTIEVISATGKVRNTYSVAIHPFNSGISARMVSGTGISNNGFASDDAIVEVSNLYVTSVATKRNGTPIAWPTDNRFSLEGTYALTTTRVDGIPFTFTFTIDKTPPKITARDKNGSLVADNATVYGDVTVTVTEANVKTLTVFCNGYYSTWPTDGKFSPIGPIDSITSHGISVTDKAGSYIYFSFQVKRDVRTVYFYTKGGSPIAPITVETGSRITAPTPPTQNGYTFGGWYKDTDCTVPWNFSTDVVTANMNLYALWIRNLTVNFNTQGGSYLAPVAVANGSLLTAPAGPTRSGYTFGGWYKDASCTLQWNFSADVVTADTTLYALWYPGAVQVHFNTQGGSGVADITTSVNSLISAPPAPTRPGYNFTGWFQDTTCTLPWNFGANTVTQDRTLFAGWAVQTPNNYLYGIGLSAGGLTRGFSAAVTNYTVNLGENDPSVTITPAKAYDGAAMTIDGKAIGAKTIALANGKTATVTVKVTWNRKSITYKLKVQRAKSTANTLAALNASAGTWSQPFDPSVANYTLTLPENVGRVSLGATRASGLATVSPAKGSFNLKNGQMVRATFKVKAQSGATRTYTVFITRARSTNANLASLKLNVKGMAPGFSPAVTDYVLTLPAKTASVTIAAKAADKLSTVRINGAKKASLAVKLANGQTATVTVTVTAQSGDVKSYTITVNRQ